MQPILQVFKLDPMYYERCRRLFEDTLMEYDLKRTKSQKITDFFKIIPKKEKDTRKKTIIIKRSLLEKEQVEEPEESEDETLAYEDLVDMASYEF